MKARQTSYLQMPFRVFVKMFPEVAEELKELPIFNELLEDPDYIVRVMDGIFEIGYAGDAWTIS